MRLGLFCYELDQPTHYVYHRDHSVPSSRIPLLAAVAGSMVTRTTSRRAFAKQGRGKRLDVFPARRGWCLDEPGILILVGLFFKGVVTGDMLPEIGGSFVEIFGQEGEKGWGSSESGAGKL